MSEKDRTSSDRSARLRSKRSQQEQQRASQAAEKARRPVSTPPVMSRGSMAGVGARKGRVVKPIQGNVRPRPYYSLSTPGAEVRIPAFPVIRAGWRLASLVLAVVLAVALWAMWNSAMFQVEGVRLVGAKRLSAKEIDTALKLEGIPVIEIVPDQVKADLLKAFPDFSSASVTVGLPAGLTVQVVERQPVLAWQETDQTLWIDQQGVAFPARGEMPDLMTIQASGTPPPTLEAPASESQGEPVPAAAEAPKKFIDPNMLPAILKLNGQPPAGTPVLYDPRYGLGWNDPGGWKVYFGMKTDDMELKLQQYRVIVESLTKQNIHPVLISVEFPHAPFYRLEQ